MRTTMINLLLRWGSPGALAAMVLGCSGTPSVSVKPDLDALEPGVAERAALDPTKPGAALVCNVTTPQGDYGGPSVYVLSAINYKLAHYPELAAVLGTDLVVDCEGARAFADTYEDYSASHPDFDADQPPAPMAASDDSPPPAFQSTVETEKILDGVEGKKNNPVVHLVFPFSTGGHPTFAALAGQQLHCSGTFIAKNWILPAAHCVAPAAVDKCIRDGKAVNNCVPSWDIWGKWFIQGTRDDEHNAYTIRTVARAYIQGDWTGRDWTTDPYFCPVDHACYDLKLGADHDIALLYVPDDTVLPAFVEEDGAKRLSIGDPDLANWKMSMWGWGDPAAGGVDPLTGSKRMTLRTNNLLPDLRINGIVVRGTTPDTGRSLPCGGDSGGPLFRDDVPINTNLGPLNAQGIIGVLSAGFDDCAQEPDPEKRILRAWRWARVDIPAHVKFIRDALGHWPSYKGPRTCTGRRLLSGTPPTEQGNPVLDECWGTPCSEANCPSGQSCSHAGRDYVRALSSCYACDGGACDCIIGQCLPN